PDRLARGPAASAAAPGRAAGDPARAREPRRRRPDLMAEDPLDVAARLAGCRGRVLLHSARDDDGLGRWSFASAEPSATLIARGRSLVRLDETGRPVRRFTADPFDAVQDFLAEHGCRLEAVAAGPPV